MRHKVLYRIITGRLHFSRGDLFLYIADPDANTINESYNIYDSVYSDAMASDNYVESEINAMLMSQGNWTPNEEQEKESIQNEIKRLKVYAYENYYKRRELFKAKTLIQKNEDKIFELESRKNQLRRQSCEGLAEEERRMWTITNSVYNMDGSKYNFEDKDSEITEDDIIAFTLSNGITQVQIRDIAKNDPWRTMWMTSTKSGDLFNKPSTQLTEYQLALCQYSIMYDNVYQNMECPPDEVIMDDDCLDGWFIVERKKQKEQKREKNSRSLLSGNPKIMNAQERYIMVDGAESAKRVYDMNSGRSKEIMKQRFNTIDEKGRAKQGNFEDVKQEVALNSNRAYVEQMKQGK